MKKILIVDYIFEETHRVMNTNLIECFANFSQVDVISINEYYKKEKKKWTEKNIKVMEEFIKPKKKGVISSRLFSIRIIQKVKKIVKLNRYDLIVALGFETMTYVLNCNISSTIPVALFHHKNIDELTNKIKKMVFNIYKNKVYHLVFEDFFATYLNKEMKIDTKRIGIIPHPIVNFDSMQKIGISYECVGLCNSNSEDFINRIILLKDEFKKNNINILLRSKKKYGQFDSIKIISGFLNSDIYNRYLYASKSVLVAIPASYVYRLSASIYDALCRKKIVFTNSKYFGKEYAKRYPGTIFYIENEKDLLEKLINLDKSQYDDESFVSFISDHSIFNTSKKLEEWLNNVN